MRTYEKYKPSGIDWIGDIPEHWKVKKLKFLTKVNSTALAEKQKEDFTIKYIDISSVNSNGEIIQTADFLFSESPSRARRIVKANDTIVSTVRTYLKAIAFIEKDVENLICSTGFAVIRPDEDIEGKFLFSVCFSNYFIEAVVSLSKGVSYPAIDSEDVKNILIWIPTLPEQTAIADYLDEQTEQIDKLIANKKRLIELLKEERTAIINQAVTKGINAEAKLKPSGIEWLGDIPEHWEVLSLNYRFEVQLGKMLDAKRITGKKLAPYLRNVDVQWGKINTEALPLMDFSEADKEKYSIKKGDLLVCEGGEIGRCAIWSKQDTVCFYQKALHRVRPIEADKNSVNFLFHLMLIASKRGLFSATGNSSTIEHLPAEKLKKHRFSFPPIAEQKEIVEFIESKTNETDSTISKIENEIELIKEYRTALISEVVRGKIKVA